VRLNLPMIEGGSLRGECDETGDLCDLCRNDDLDVRLRDVNAAPIAPIPTAVVPEAANVSQVGYYYHGPFTGSPRDKEFLSQLRIDEMTLCSKLYSR
jgi:hypothetical protein